MECRDIQNPNEMDQQTTQSAAAKQSEIPFVNPYKRPRITNQGSSNNTSSNITFSAATTTTTTTSTSASSNLVADNHEIQHIDESTLIATTGASLMKLPLSYAVNSRRLTDRIAPSFQNDDNSKIVNPSNETNDSNYQLEQPPTENMKQPKQSVSNNLSLAERLPSNNISCPFATILTVPETRKAVSTYTNYMCSKCNSQRNEHSTTGDQNVRQFIHHVRVSGTVIYMDPKHQFLIMGDALFKPRPVTKMKQFISTTPSSCINKADGAPTQTVNKSIKTMISTSLSGKKQRLITVKKNTSSSLMKSTNKFGIKSLGSSSSLLQSSNNTRHGFKATSIPHTQTEVEQIIQKKGDMDMIIIDISKMEIVIGKPGDNIMVIGDIQSKSCFEMNDASKEWILALQCLRRKWFTNDDYDDDTMNSTEATCDCMGWMEAKIVKDITGTDMVLYQEALEMRRAYFNDDKTMT